MIFGIVINISLNKYAVDKIHTPQRVLVFIDQGQK